MQVILGLTNAISAHQMGKQGSGDPEKLPRLFCVNVAGGFPTIHT